MVTGIVFTLSLQNSCWQCWERRGGQVRKGRAPSLVYATQTSDPSFPILLLSPPSHCVEEDKKSLFWVSFLVSIWKDFIWPRADLTLEGFFWPVMKRQKPQGKEFFLLIPSQSTEIQEREWIVAKSWPLWFAMWSQKYNQHQEYLGRESFFSCY